MDLLSYYEDLDEDLSKEEKQYQKTLDGTNVSRERYNNILKKVEEMKIHSQNSCNIDNKAILC